MNYNDFIQEMHKTVGANIRNLRCDKGLTQMELAKKANIKAGGAHICLVEAGKRGLRLERLYSIADVLDVPLTELLKGMPNPKHTLLSKWEPDGTMLDDTHSILAYVGKEDAGGRTG